MVCFALFETEIGLCGLAWGTHGVLGVQLPESEPQKTRARLLQRFPGAREAKPEAIAQSAVRRIVSLLRGEACDLAKIPVDMSSVPPFHRRVYDAARKISRGTTVTYGAIASWIGAPKAARAVGQALARNPLPLLVPCHRVVAAGGQMGGFSAEGGIAAKLRLLAIEGAYVPGGPWPPARFIPQSASRRVA